MIVTVYRLLCLAGIVVSVYGKLVALYKKQDSSYRAACDFGSAFSCSTALTSEYANGFGIIGPLLGHDHFLNISNSVYGIFFYAALFVIGGARSQLMRKLNVLLGAVSCAMSVYLAYILYAILHDFCLVCVTIYVVNILLFILAIVQLRRLTAKDPRHTR
ncbi:vitamin K epoxide reductase complex subunit 1-like [Sycon ciliatum]|uniref:vitamin K epoxide reductase complex subunit 1-like n=1 Tax=Sycon ciliatum TaxID=27933 RepID=UPI0031F6EDBE|eukprot:scpid73737/ scgid33176/ Vitamin K epoxide reductase complex subunit 1; Vitamin K1 2,3-epoxide reductase subunit 1